MVLKRTHGKVPLIQIPLARDRAGRDEIPTDADQLEYMADLVRELNAMSIRSGWTIIAAVFGLAHFAILQQHDAVRRAIGAPGGKRQ